MPSFRNRRPLTIALAFLCPFGLATARADYAWIADYLRLQTKVGVEYYTTQDNFGSDGALTPLASGARLTDYIFLVEPEIGIAEGWSLGMDLKYFSSSVDGTGGTSLLTGSGLGDVTARLKWVLRPGGPLLTAEGFIKAPTSSVPASDRGELVVSEGNFDAGLIVHSGHTAGTFRFDISPGLLGRFGGYASAATVDGMVELVLARGYVRIFENFIYSFTDTRLYDSSLDKHDAPGTGGSYSRLAGSPIGLSAGLKLGLKIVDNYYLEASASRAVFGTRYPADTRIGVDLVFAVDFFTPQPKTKKVHEIPLDGEANRPYQ